MHTRDDLSCERGYEFWLASEAKKRNPDVKLYGLSWGVSSRGRGTSSAAWGGAPHPPFLLPARPCRYRTGSATVRQAGGRGCCCSASPSCPPTARRQAPSSRLTTGSTRRTSPTASARASAPSSTTSASGTSGAAEWGESTASLGYTPPPPLPSPRAGAGPGATPRMSRACARRSTLPVTLRRASSCPTTTSTSRPSSPRRVGGWGGR